MLYYVAPVPAPPPPPRQNVASEPGQPAPRDPAKLQRDKQIRWLLDLDDRGVAELAAQEPRSVARARERSVSEALTAYVRSQDTTVNQAVRLFKVRSGAPAHTGPWQY